MWALRSLIAVVVFIASMFVGEWWSHRPKTPVTRPNVPDLIVSTPRGTISIGAEVSLIGRVHYAMDFLVMPSVFAVIDQARPGVRRIVFIDRKTGKTAVVLGGDSDNSARYAYRLFKDPLSVTRLWVVDSRSKSIYAVDTEDKIDVTGVEYFFPPDQVIDGSPVWLNEHELVTAADVAKDFLTVWSTPSAGALLQRRSTGGDPPYEMRVRSGSAPHLNRGTLVRLGDEDIFIFASRYTSKIDLYSRNLEKRRTIIGPVESPLVFNDLDGVKPAPSNKFHRPDTRWTYVDGVAYRGTLWALFSGRAWASATELHIATSLQTFDNTNRLLDDQLLPRSLFALDVDVNGTLYALCDGDSGIVELLTSPNKGATSSPPQRKGG